MKFINRTAETQYLKDFFAHEPNALLFVYGPKSSGKSTLLQNVIMELPHDRFTVNFMNLREVLIYDFMTFLDTFFPKTLYGKVKDLADGVTFNLGFFGLNVDDEKIVKQNPFKVMGEKLRAVQVRGKKPVIVLDEIQLLKNIYMNSTRYLLDELFNLFVSLTKTAHVAHVVLATSDSYFIEEVYVNARLQQCGQLLFVDHLSHQAVTSWLAEENFTEEEIQTVWHYLGGSPWEIQQLLLRKQDGLPVKEVCQYFLNEKYGKMLDRLLRLPQHQKPLLYKVLTHIVQHGCYHLAALVEQDGGLDILKDMVAHDFWFYRVEEQTIVANAKSYGWAFKRMLDERQTSFRNG